MNLHDLIAPGKRKATKEIKHAISVNAQFMTPCYKLSLFELNCRGLFLGKLSLWTFHIDGFLDLKTFLLHLLPLTQKYAKSTIKPLLNVCAICTLLKLVK